MGSSNRGRVVDYGFRPVTIFFLEGAIAKFDLSQHHTTDLRELSLDRLRKHPLLASRVPHPSSDIEVKHSLSCPAPSNSQSADTGRSVGILPLILVLDVHHQSLLLNRLSPPMRCTGLLKEILQLWLLFFHRFRPIFLGCAHSALAPALNAALAASASASAY